MLSWLYYSIITGVHQQISAKDLILILQIFTLAELDDVYPHLGITNQQIKTTLQIGNVPQREAKSVLYGWRDKNEDFITTRKTMIGAIKKVPRCNKSLSELIEKWGITGKRNL